jgi:hypothetical protein
MTATSSVKSAGSSTVWPTALPGSPALRLGGAPEDYPEQTVSAKQSRAAWARLLAKVYDVDVLRGRPSLQPLWFSDEGARGHHRSTTMPQDNHPNLSPLARASPCPPRRCHCALPGTRLHDHPSWRRFSQRQGLRWPEGWVQAAHQWILIHDHGGALFWFTVPAQ